MYKLLILFLIMAFALTLAVMNILHSNQEREAATMRLYEKQQTEMRIKFHREDCGRTVTCIEIQETMQ